MVIVTRFGCTKCGALFTVRQQADVHDRGCIPSEPAGVSPPACPHGRVDGQTCSECLGLNE